MPIPRIDRIVSSLLAGRHCARLARWQIIAERGADMSSDAGLVISSDDVERYQLDGAVLLRGVFADWVEPLREGVEAVLRSPSPLERTYRPADGSAPFFQDFCNWGRIPQFKRFVFESPAAEVVARLMASRTARFFHDHVLVKEPGTTTVTPWHQDQPYYCVEVRQTVSFWTVLDPVSREVTIEFVAGSHRSGRGYRPKRFDGTPLYPADDFEELPDIEGHRDQFSILGWAMVPGDAVAFAPCTRRRPTPRAAAGAARSPLAGSATTRYSWIAAGRRRRRSRVWP